MLRHSMERTGTNMCWKLAATMFCFCSMPAGLHAYQNGTTEWTSVVSRTTAAVVVIETDRGLGSGFVVRPNGMLVTNHHVVAGASQIAVTFSSGEKYQKAFVLAEDEDRDLAILRIEGSDLPALSIASTADLEIGAEVLLIGAPEGLSHTVSTGVVSAIRLLKNGMRIIQTTAPASPGSSGGPLLTRDGHVIGVLTFQFSEGQNLNFVVPSNYVQGMMETLEKFSAGTPLRTLTRLTPRTTYTSASGPSTPAVTPAQSVPVSPREALAAAKTICIYQRNGNPVVSNEISGAIVKWGKLAVVAGPDQADLVLDVSQTGSLDLLTGAGNQAAAKLVHRQSGLQLWAATKGGSWAMSGWSNAWVGRSIAKDVVKFIDSQLKTKK
jgi:S1-C subfamily serine protease